MPNISPQKKNPLARACVCVFVCVRACVSVRDLHTWLILKLESSISSKLRVVDLLYRRLNPFIYLFGSIIDRVHQLSNQTSKVLDRDCFGTITVGIILSKDVSSITVLQKMI